MNKPLEGHTTSEIIEELNRRSRRFKFFAVAFMFLAALTLILIVVIGLNSLQRANDQLAQQKQLLETQNQTLGAIKASSDQRTRQLQEVNEHIDCIARFFNDNNRENTTVDDLDRCTITSNNGGSVSSPPKASSGSSGGSTAQNSTTPSTSANKPSQTPPNKPETPQPTGIRRIPFVNGLLKLLGL